MSTDGDRVRTSALKGLDPLEIAGRRVIFELPKAAQSLDF